MSAFQMNSKPVSEISEFLACLLNNGYNYFGFSPSTELSSSLSACRGTYGDYKASLIYKALSELNLASLNGRYRKVQVKECGWTAYEPFKEYPAVYHPKEWEEGHCVIKQWHYDILKKLECLLYQCDEAPADGTPLYKALEGTINSLTAHIVHNSTEWQSSEWGA